MQAAYERSCPSVLSQASQTHVLDMEREPDHHFKQSLFCVRLWVAQPAHMDDRGYGRLPQIGDDINLGLGLDLNFRLSEAIGHRDEMLPKCQHHSSYPQTSHACE